MRKEQTKKIDLLIQDYIERYKQDGKPIELRFRDILPELNSIDRCTHLIHPYPAKLLAHIPFFFLNNNKFSKKGDTVLDPFSGSGTVLLEAILSGRNGLGADINPLARLISSVKVKSFDVEELRLELPKILIRAKKVLKPDTPNVVHLDYWYSKRIQKLLSKIYTSILVIESSKVRDFFIVCFSNLSKKVSYADPHVAVPVKLNPERYPIDSISRKKTIILIEKITNTDIFGKFEEICRDNIARIDKLNEALKKNTKAKIISHNALCLTESIESNVRLKSNSVQLIITSPPYAGAQKYIRASSLCLNWTKLASPEELRYLDSKSIGRENYRSEEVKSLVKTNVKEADKLLDKAFKINPTRAVIAANYLVEMNLALQESHRVLKKGGFIVLVVGNNRVCKMEFNIQQYLCTYLELLGMKPVLKMIDDINSYGLMTKRNKTADIISREWVLVYKK